MYIQQGFDDSPSQLLMLYTENIFLFILLSSAIFLIVTTPIVLTYFGVKNYIKWKANGSLMTHELCCQERKNHPTYVSSVCQTYQKSFTRLVGSITGLMTWNVLSVVYIYLQFPNFKSGVIEYFLFPFEVVETYTLSNMISSINQYNTNWISMLSILSITVVSYYVAKAAAVYFMSRKRIQQVEELALA